MDTAVRWEKSESPRHVPRLHSLSTVKKVMRGILTTTKRQKCHRKQHNSWWIIGCKPGRKSFHEVPQSISMQSLRCRCLSYRHRELIDRVTVTDYRLQITDRMTEISEIRDQIPQIRRNSRACARMYPAFGIYDVRRVSCIWPLRVHTLE